ncbi:NAD(P)/FAD-dependent oxidoreductase [Pikeienuella sp. HZG-20]|uniref:NAD(P)/FAD-dependent oxidoreductase n=1 Tax=Paludibacillus litoralis TaxID=3133267 RepID=UPI0030EE2256
MDEVQTVVIGAGVVGLALARALARSGREVLILEAESAFGSHTSARNSEVVHAGIYYAAGGLKARLCVEGRRRLYAYCAERGVDIRACGKLIVAADEAEAATLDGIAMRARANGVDDLQRLTGAEARRMEPALQAAAALWSPSTGIVDSHGLMLSLLGEAEEAGAMLALRAPVAGIERRGERFEIEVAGEAPVRLLAREVVNAAGHGAARLSGALTAAPRMWMAKGSYFRLSGRAPFTRLVYPAPIVGGLGVHLSLDLGGQARFGPDVEWVDRLNYEVDPARAAGFYAAIRRYWPDLPEGALAPDYAGVRPKLAGPEAGGGADFRIDGPDDHGVPGYLALYGIESPGLTSCLALADHAAALLGAPRA